MPDISSKDADILNQFEGLLSFQWTWAFKYFIHMPFDNIALFTGNQCMKTASCAIQYVFRIMGWHPIPKKNVLYFECPELVKEEETADKAFDDTLIKHPWVSRKLPDGSSINLHREGDYFDSVFYPGAYPKRYYKSLRPKDNKCTFCGAKLRVHKRKTRVFRFAGEVLPGDSDTVGDGGQSTEVKNAAYPEFKKWLPAFLIKRDITARKFTMLLHDPNNGHEFGDIKYKGEDIVVEFVAYSQPTKGAGVQRLSIWQDEEGSIDWYEEQGPRLVAEDGDFLTSLTPANKITWTYDELYERAQLNIKTDCICEFLRKGNPDKEFNNFTWTDSSMGIAVIQAATDDNPTLSRKSIEKHYEYDDEETIATRRYGIFAQSTGRVFGDFNTGVHVVDFSNLFMDGVIPE